MPEIGNTQEEIVNEDIQEIIHSKPGWIIRKGNVLFLLVLTGILIASWLVEYPDIIHCNAHFVARQQPKFISAKKDGRLLKLLIPNNGNVQKDQPLALIESTANYEDVLSLYKWLLQTLDSTKTNSYQSLTSNPLPVLRSLGDIQAGYQELYTAYSETRQFLTNGYYTDRKAALQQDLRLLENIKLSDRQQLSLMETDQQLQSKEFDAYKALEKQKVIAPLELNQYQSRLLSKDQGLQQMQSRMANTSLSLNNKYKEIQELEKSAIDQSQRFQSALLNLKSKVENWFKEYVLTAPENGRLVYLTSLQENTYITTQQDLFYVQVPGSEFLAEVMAAQKGLGKIKPGQKVVMKVDSYPSDEYGVVTGTVMQIMDMPNRSDSFLINVTLDKGLTTNYNKSLQFRNYLTARAEVQTDNKRLFNRLLGQLNRIIER